MTDDRISIRPLRSNGRTMQVSPRLHKQVAAIVSEFHGFPPDEKAARDAVWELARSVLEAQAEDREREDRHARGDYSQELNELEGRVHDLLLRVDGTPYLVAMKLLTSIHDSQASGFTGRDMQSLQKLFDKIVEEVHKTDEMVVALGDRIRELGEFV